MLFLAVALAGAAALALLVYAGVRRVFSTLYSAGAPVFWGLERGASVQKQALALRSLSSSSSCALPRSPSFAGKAASDIDAVFPVGGIGSLPDELLCSIWAMSGASPLELSAVCREWRRLADTERVKLRGRPGVQVPMRALLALLRRSPRVRSLRLRRAVSDLARLDRALLIMDQAPAVFRPQWFLTHFRRTPAILLSRFRRSPFRVLPAVALYLFDAACGLWVLAVFWGLVCPFCRAVGRLRDARDSRRRLAAPEGGPGAAPPAPWYPPDLQTLDLCGAFRHDVLPLGILHHLSLGPYSALRSVDLGYNNLGDVGVCMFAAGALRPCPALRSFDLSFTGFGSDGMRDIAEALLEASAAGRSFDRVALRAHLPISSAARTLGEALARARIASLHLGLGEYAYAEDFLAVAAGIARNAAFQELELGDCACVETPGPVARERALRAAFAAVGASGPSLIRLELSGPVFGSRGVGPALRHELSPPAAAALRGALAGCGRLESVAVRDYGFGSGFGPGAQGGPHPLPAALAALAPHLLSIDVGRSQLPAACLADLAAALPAAPRLRRLAAHFLSWSASDGAPLALLTRAAYDHPALLEVGLAGIPIQALAVFGAQHDRAGRLSFNLGYAGIYSQPELLLASGAGAEVCLIWDHELVYSGVGEDLEHLLAVPTALHFKSVADCESGGAPWSPPPTFPILGYFTEGFVSRYRLARPPYGADAARAAAAAEAAAAGAAAPPGTGTPASGLRRRGAAPAATRTGSQSVSL